MSTKANDRALSRGPGQPRKLAPAYRHPVWRETPPEDIAAQIERLASEHMSIARIAVELITSRGTLTRWMTEDPILRECYERGKARAEHELYMQIVDAARNGEKLNMPAVYALNNRHGWRVEQAEGASPTVVTDPPEKLEALHAFTEKLIPGRWKDARQPNEQELRATSILRMPLAEVSAKVRTGPPLDDEPDYALPIWAGVVPLRLAAGAPVRDEKCDAALPVPSYAVQYTR